MPTASQVYNTPGTYTFTPPAGVTAVWARYCGGGGGGSGTQSDGTNGNAGGGGGGAEWTAPRLIPTPGSITIVVADKGAAGPSAGFGTDGGATQVDAFYAQGGFAVHGSSITPRGGVGAGVGGGAAPTNPTQAGNLGSRQTARCNAGNSGGAGGTRTAGTFGGTGGGAPGQNPNNATGGSNGGGGAGANTTDGLGGNGGDNTGHTTGFPATGYGSGGGGAAGNANVAGGAGAVGLVELFWIG